MSAVLTTMHRKIRSIARRALQSAARSAVNDCVLESVEPRRLFTTYVSGTVFGDTNRDGVRNDAEVPVGAYAVYADYNYNAKLDVGEPFAMPGFYGEYVLPVNDVPFALRLQPAPGGGTVTTNPWYYEVTNGHAVGYGSNFGVQGQASAVGATVATDVDGNGAIDRFDPEYPVADAWIDTNGNNLHDSGEPVLGQQQQGLHADRGYVDYALAAFPGTYPVAVRYEGDTDNVADATHLETIAADGSVSSASSLFLLPPKTSVVTGTVFRDTNGNGTRDAGEVASGFDYNGDALGVYADLNNNGVLDAGEPTSVLNYDSRYALEVGNRAGTIRAYTSSNYTITTAARPFDFTNGKVTLSGQDIGYTDTPVISKPGTTITGTVYTDTNGNGRFDAGDVGVDTVQVYADYNYNGIEDANEPLTRPSENGTYSLFVDNRAFALRIKPFNNLTTPSTPSAGIYYYELRNGVPAGYGSDFAVKITSSATGQIYASHVYEDANGNGFLDSGERYLTAIEMWIDTNQNGKVDAGESATMGATLTLPLGSYHIGVGGINAAGNFVTVTKDLTLATPGQQIFRDFVFSASRAFISGRLVFDANGDGLEQSSERYGYSGQASVVWADYDGDGVVDANEPLGTIDSGGGYSLAVEPGRTFPIRVKPANGFTQSLPVGNAGRILDVSTITYITGQDFWFVTGAPTITAIPINVTLNGTTTGVSGQTAFADYNYNGMLDAGEDSAVTDATGAATLNAQLKPFQLVLKTSSTYAQSSPANHGVWYYEVQNGSLIGHGSAFSVTSNVVTPPTTGTGTISVTWFVDYDSDGKRSAGDGEYLRSFSDNVDAFIDMNRDGTFDAGDQRIDAGSRFGGGYDYSFLDLAAGTYHIVLGGLASGESITGGMTRDVTVGNGATVDLDLPVAGYKLAQLTPNVFFDANRNGFQDPGEYSPSEYDQLKIYADLNYNGAYDTGEPTWSVPNHYGVGLPWELSPGSYSIRVANDDGTAATFAYGATSRWVTLDKPGVFTTQLGIVPKA